MVLGWWQSTVGGGNIKMARIWGLSLPFPPLFPSLVPVLGQPKLAETYYLLVQLA
jgi:hypothetical protein